jgi:hypothetical protein
MPDSGIVGQRLDKRGWKNGRKLDSRNGKAKGSVNRAPDGG